MTDEQRAQSSDLEHTILGGNSEEETAIREKLSRVTSKPGVYLMKDDRGKVIYVGKARNLKKRVLSYFKTSDQLDLKTRVLVRKIATFETIITGTETEALILESSLIKRYRPRYNVILKDDKRYPSLCLDVRHPYPNLLVVRKIKNDGAMYFGPFASPSAVYHTLRVINKTFKLRKCKAKVFRNRTRPCLNYQMETCLGPCCLDVDQAVYDDMVREVILFLKGKTPELIQKVRKEMAAAAYAQDYENAAMLRDRMFALESVLEKQVSVTPDFKDRDIFAIARGPEISLITLLFVRGGYLLGKQHFSFSETLSTDAEMLGTFIRQYYEQKTHFIPKEILIPFSLEDAPLMEAWLREIKGEKVGILRPRRGEKARLLRMALENAENGLKERIASANSKADLLTRLRKRLKMDSVPNRIECFDNSNILGMSPVSGMVVFEKGKPRKSAYRRYKIRTVTEPDDYASMAEVLKRRYGKEDEGPMPAPDLLMVDGGKGQLSIAVSVIRELGLEGEFEIIGIAKKDEKNGETRDKIYKPGQANPVGFGREEDLLFFLQQIRDEAHRFAITFHRKERNANSIRSELDGIPGIGKKRKQTLLRHFKGIQNIREATLDEISALPGMNRLLAEKVRTMLRKQ
ncbi:MAG: excinuclease ABC subunit C [Desulfobacteraceae bacterium 4572_88]|nr:MAG: excinuclease ABC subunit C [Desulfobacteraceae bacterium 4572_88]